MPNRVALGERRARVRPEALRRRRSEAPVEALVEVRVGLARAELVVVVLRLVVEPGGNTRREGEIGSCLAGVYESCHAANDKKQRLQRDVALHYGVT